MLKINLHWDDIIYQLQKHGGISNYWQEVTTQSAYNSVFNIRRTKGSRRTRLLPVISNADIFHSSYFRVPLSVKTKHIATVYDFLYELGWIKTPASIISIFQRKQAIQRADAIICISHNTKKDLLSFFPDLNTHPHIYVVPLGTSLGLTNHTHINVSSRLVNLATTVNHRYILFVGTRTGYKNFNAALHGFVASPLPKQGYALVCTGSAFSEPEQQEFRKLGIQDKVFVLEYASDSELNYLYQNAFALLYPSLYEGFGLPLLEAMNCGCPAIAANTSALLEVVGNAGILIDPYNPSTISDVLEMLLEETKRNNYIAKGFVQASYFSWEKSRQQHIEIYQALSYT